MHTFIVRNVNEALPVVLNAIKVQGIRQESRNGPTLEFDGPVATEYRHPTERVLFCAARDHNPFFAFFETLWMLAGRDDLEYLLPFNKNMAQYSDDGRLVRGSAYGKRWKGWFDDVSQDSACNPVPFRFDQLKWAIETLTADPDSRRVVVQMWDAATDPQISSKDIPCNLCVLFKVREGRLNMTVYNRSNDVIYGAYGSNAVHFSMLQEYVASHLGVQVGVYNQVSDSLHVYTEFDVTKKVWNLDPLPDDPYDRGEVSPSPMFDRDVPAHLWDVDLKNFMEDPENPIYSHSFFDSVAHPMWMAHLAYRDKSDPERFTKAKHQISLCCADDWRKACWEWLDRRQEAAKK